MHQDREDMHACRLDQCSADERDPKVEKFCGPALLGLWGAQIKGAPATVWSGPDPQAEPFHDRIGNANLTGFW
ncbi:hypothetical protein POI8812_00635 [Pontivivens insulae]|uniref:Uncharacterized protein n=2 Tax=Pontivivens insulae TaxID=1639689 RepID=A0A2R8A7W6_9RHOB|nr:hypothetical protein DFR53_0634 [Pontivivens insulae]SPF28337.1 hypothetical protein POI8812_00635 [Pontivivens insulae]